MIAAAALMAIAAVSAEILHRRVCRGFAPHPIALQQVGRFTVAGLVLALLRMLEP